MYSLKIAPRADEALSRALYDKAVTEIAKLATDLSRITIHGKSNFARAYLHAENEEDVFNRLKTTKFHVQLFENQPIIVAHFIFRDPPEHERVFIKILPDQRTSEHIRFVLSEDGGLDVDEIRPLTYQEVTNLCLDLSLAREATRNKS